ncbi:MAG: hypothetical protein ACI4JT_11145 [Oscillospiraceae bacterium]
METENLEQEALENAPEVTEIDEQQLLLSEKETEIDALKKELDESSKRLLSISLTLSEAETKLALLLAGAAKEKLAEAVSLTSMLCKSGKTPEEAAAEIIAAYPHLKAVQREIPQFSAGSSGTNDGFSAVRRIFSAK